jgi:hypothetical protein
MVPFHVIGSVAFAWIAEPLSAAGTWGTNPLQALRIACTKNHLIGSFRSLSKSEQPGGFFLDKAAMAEAAAALLLEGKAASGFTLLQCREPCEVLN